MNPPRSELCTSSISSTVVLPEKDRFHSLNDSSSSLKRNLYAGLGKTVKKCDFPLKATAMGNHFMNIAETLMKYREKGFLCDAVLVAKCGRELKAHSALLTAVSPVFLVAIQEKPSSGTYHLCFPEVELDVLEIAVHFVYTGKLLLPAVYSQMNRLSKLFDKLSDLGLNLHKLHGCEMTFERSAKQPPNPSKRGISVASALSNLEKQKGQGNREQEWPESKYRRALLKNGKNKTMVCNVGVVTKPVMEPVAGAHHPSGTGSQELNIMRTGLLLDQNVGKVATLDSNSYGIHEAIVDDNGVPNSNTQGDIFNLVEPSPTDNKLMFADKLADKASASSKALVCEYCRKPNAETFNTELELVQHKISCHYDLFNVCNYCGRRSSSSENFWIHIKRHLGLNPRKNHKCNDCGLHFAKPGLLKRHRLRHTGERPHECPECKKHFTALGSLKRHQLLHSEYHPFLCDFCGKGFNQKAALTNHVTLQHEFTCALCGCKQTSKADMEKHALEVHELGQDELNSIITNPRTYLCDLCGKNCVSLCSLRSHLKVHRKTFHCTICGSTFSKSDELRLHMRIHADESPFVCDVCQRSFAQESMLMMHLTVHSGIKPFACVICSRSFSTNGHLKQHMKEHTTTLRKKKHFKCGICSFQCSHRSQLVVHNRIHTGERPYKCKICSKQLISSGTLTRHIRTHTGDKPYSCTECEMSFAQSQNLSSHMRTHTNERPFICEICSKSFKQKVDLRNHFVRFHRIDVSSKSIEINGNVKVPIASDSSDCIVDELRHELDNM